MERKVVFERGHNCIVFECLHNSPDCRPRSGGSHGLHGMQIRFLLTGDKGAVQFLLGTDWVPFHAEPNSFGHRAAPQNFGKMFGPMPIDLGYHSPVQMHEDQEPMGPCEYLGGKDCYYDGSGLNAGDAFYALVNGGEDALWEFLEEYYRSTFEGGDYPEPKGYEKPLRS